MVLETITSYAVKMFSGLMANISSIPADQVIIFDIAFILIVSAIIAFIARALKQPLIPAYVLTGFIIGPMVLGLVQNVEVIKTLSEIGIAFLLFAAGLEISFKKIKEANLKKIGLIGTFQILIVFFLTLILRNLIGLNQMQAVYIGIVLAFGSTMVVIKLLSDKGELITMHGRIVLGILLLQDLFAILAIAVFMSGGFAFAPIFMAIIKLVAILLFALLLQTFILNRLFRFAATSTEMLLLSSLGVLFLFVVLSYLADLSIVIGAFIAGVSLANSPFKLELESRITPLRDFFAILFFVALGMQIVFTGIVSYLDLFVFLLVVAILIKPFITFILLRIGGYRPKTSFLSAISLAQMSEFSLIIGMLGLTLGVLNPEIFSTIVLATIITMGLTTYFIEFKNRFFIIFEKPMKLFKFLPIHEKLEYRDKKNKSILLIGSHRMGSILLKSLLERKDELLVIDYNPEIINSLKTKRISCIYGDLSSPEILDKINIYDLKLVVSTVPNFDDNLFLLRKMKERNKKVKVILTADKIDDAMNLYDEGADYVILPKVVAGEEVVDIIKSKGTLNKKRSEHKRELEKVHRILY